MQITLFGRQFFVNKILIVFSSIVIVIVIGFLGYFLKQTYKPLSSTAVSSTELKEERSNIIQATETKPLDEKNSTDELNKADEEQEIKVYVVGCVNRPGVVNIKKGQVIEDAIKMAGGATKEADLDNINLAYILNENTMLRIKSKNSNIVGEKITSNGVSNIQPDSNKSNYKETQQKRNTATTNDNSDTATSNKLNSGVDIVTDSLGCVVEEEKSDSKKEGGLININKASQAELENIPKVGPATAKAIISYREKNGDFKKLTDIMKITGIKQKTYDKIKDYICID